MMSLKYYCGLFPHKRKNTSQTIQRLLPNISAGVLFEGFGIVVWNKNSFKNQVLFVLALFWKLISPVMGHKRRPMPLIWWLIQLAEVCADCREV